EVGLSRHDRGGDAQPEVRRISNALQGGAVGNRVQRGVAKGERVRAQERGADASVEAGTRPGELDGRPERNRIDRGRAERGLTTAEHGNLDDDGEAAAERKEQVDEVAARQGDARCGDEGTGGQAPGVLHGGASYCTRLSSEAWGTKLWSSVVP